MAKILNKNGRNFLQEHLADCAVDIEKKINENVLANIGVTIESLNIFYDEDSAHVEKRDSMDWQILAKNRFGE